MLSAYREVLLSQKVEGSLDVGVGATQLLDCVCLRQKRWELIRVQLSLLVKEFMSKGLLSRNSLARIELKQALKEIETF